MTLLWYMLGGFGLSVLGYLLAIFYIRRRDGIRPGYTGLLIMCISMGGFLLLFLVLRRFGLDLLHGGPRDIFFAPIRTVSRVRLGPTTRFQDGECCPKLCERSDRAVLFCEPACVLFDVIS
jgi:hypothetical protein